MAPDMTLITLLGSVNVLLLAPIYFILIGINAQLTAFVTSQNDHASRIGRLEGSLKQ